MGQQRGLCVFPGPFQGGLPCHRAAYVFPPCTSGQGSDNLWKLPGGPLMVAQVSPLPSTLWDRGLASRGSCPRVVLGVVPRGPAAKEGMIRSCLHSVHTPAPTPWALGLSVPEAALTCSLRLVLPSWRGLSPCAVLLRCSS